MGEPGFYPHPVENLRHLQTHLSHVFLTGPYAYKLKKPLNLGFADFSSLQKRIHFCRQELTLNQRLAPDIYLAVLAVAAGPRGIRLLPLDEAGDDLLEPCLQMVQMAQGRMMDRLLAQGQVHAEHIDRLAAILSRFYQQAQGGPGVAKYGSPQEVARTIEQGLSQTRGHQGLTVAPARWRAVARYSRAFLVERQDLLAQRVAAGRIRDCHGDLHSRNINLAADGQVHVFDCIEFNQRLRFQDPACDLAFLAMDLDYNRRPDLAERLQEQYVEHSGDAQVRELMDFYKCYRATVRAKVLGLALAEPEVPSAEKQDMLDQARRYWRLAARYSGLAEPFFLLAVMGRMGVGKSHLATMLAKDLGWPLYDSDRTRKRMAGLAPQEPARVPYGQGIYDPAMSQRVYEALAQEAGGRLAMGHSVILDASFARRAWRQSLASMAQGLGAQVLFVLLEAGPATVARRLKEREASGRGVSDGRLALSRQQAQDFQPPDELPPEQLISLDGGRPGEENIRRIRARLDRMGWQGAEGGDDI